MKGNPAWVGPGRIGLSLFRISSLRLLLGLGLLLSLRFRLSLLLPTRTIAAAVRTSAVALPLALLGLSACLSGGSLLRAVLLPHSISAAAISAAIATLGEHRNR